MVVVSQTVVFEEPDPLPGLIINDIARNGIHARYHGLRPDSDRKVDDLGPRRLNDFVDDVSLLDRNYPRSLVAGWREYQRHEVGILRNWKRGHIGAGW